MDQIKVRPKLGYVKTFSKELRSGTLYEDEDKIVDRTSEELFDEIETYARNNNLHALSVEPTFVAFRGRAGRIDAHVLTMLVKFRREI